MCQSFSLCYNDNSIYEKIMKTHILLKSNGDIVTVHSVHSNVAKIHSRLPAAMEFWLVCLGIVVCEQ